MKDALFPIGSVAGTHGVKGTVRVNRYVESLSFFEPGSRLILRRAGAEEKIYKVSWFKPHRKGLLLNLESVADMDGAQSLLGCEILAERSRLPELEEGTYYWMDLIGLTVCSSDDARIGLVESIITTGSNDVLVVRDGPKEILIPAIGSVIVEIDLRAGIIRVELPEGL